MLGTNDLKTGALFVYNSNPHMVLWSNHLKMQQRRPVMQTKVRNLRTGQVFEQNQIDDIVKAAKSRAKRNLATRDYIRWPFIISAIILFLLEIFIRRLYRTE